MVTSEVVVTLSHMPERAAAADEPGSGSGPGPEEESPSGEALTSVSEPARLPRSMWLLSENRRSWLATVAALALAAAALAIGIERSPELAALPSTDRAAFMLFACVVTWTLLALGHTLLTWYTYRDLRGEQFEQAVCADPGWQDRERRSTSRLIRWTIGYGPSSWSVSVSALALVVVLAMVMRPALREIPLALSLSLVMVAVSWLNVLVTYATHYARVHVTDGGLGFPGEPAEGMRDYIYFAASVMTTFASSDVEVRTRQLRWLVMGHGVLAFVFNSVIVAMFLSLLLGAA